jgi:chemotaxis protein histidine kinase CheA
MTDFSLLQDFIVETVEHLEEMEGNLLRLEANPASRETLDDIFRSVHTIKGASEYLGLEGLAELSHKLENLLDSLRREGLTVSRDVIDLLMAVRDRMRLLIDDLEATQTEQTVFADLVERLQSLLSQTRPAGEGEAPPAAATVPEALAVGADDSEYEEEFDEELFAIFLEQLEEGLTSLAAQTSALRTADRDDQCAILENCLGRIDPLRSSANYMGYDNLTDLYDGWSESILNARDRLGAGDDSFMPDFIRDYMEANLATVANRFPRIDLEVEAPPGVPVAEAPEHTPVLETTPPAEDLLDVYASADTPSAPDVPPADPPKVAADLFDRLSQSFDDCRQLGAAPARAADTAEIAAELFSTPDDFIPDDDPADPPEAEARPLAPQAAAHPATETDNPWEYLTDAESPVETPVSAEAPVPPSAPDTTGGEPAAVTAASATAPPDTAIASDNYEEEYDEELFGIFLEQLEESLGALKAHTAALKQADRSDRIGLLDACLTDIDPLRSSANYMGYAKLTSLYDDWTAAIQKTRERLATGDDGFLSVFIADTMEARITAVADRFPQLVIPDTDSKPLPMDADDEDTVAADDETLPEVDQSELGDDGEADPQAPPEAHLLALEDHAATDSAAEEKNVNLESGLLNDFLVETVEHLEEMEGSLLRLEKEPGHPGTLDDIFRSAHTIKGAAEYLGMTRMADLSHQLENLLDQLRRNERPADSDTIDLLIAARDRIGMLTEDLEQSGQEQTAIDDLLERIQNLQHGGAPATAVPAAPAANADTRADMDEPDLDIPLFAEIGDDESEAVVTASAAAENQPEETPRPSEAAGDEKDDHGANDDPLVSSDRRRSDRPGRRQSDRIGEKILKQSIRVDATKIDALMNQVGELVVSRAWFAQLFSEMRDLQQNLKQRFKLDTREMKQVKGLTFRLSEATVALGRVANELQEGVMKVRMLPIAQLFNRYPRLVFDLVRDTNKHVELDIRGEDTELDKMVIEEISDPLIHIIRNAVDHGVEPVEDRRRLNKPETATIRLEAYHEGNHVVIEIVDDGRGLDLDRIAAKALAGNFASNEELGRMTPKELTSLIMQPGFSTADKVTHTSGRGVGMDVVKKNIEKLNGTIEIDTTPGCETRFRIKIPLTLAIIPALLIKVRQELFTIPLATVEETLRIADGDISTIEGVEVMQLRETTLPLVRLDGLFNMAAPAPIERSFVVVVSTGMKRVGLVVDELLGQEEVVIKPLEDYLQERSGFSGATILGDGRISLILDIYELVNLSIDRETQKKAKAVAL